MTPSAPKSDALGGLDVARRDGGWVFGTRERTLGGPDLQRPRAALLEGDGVPDQGAEDVERGGPADGERRVEVGGLLGEAPEKSTIISLAILSRAVVIQAKGLQQFVQRRQNNDGRDEHSAHPKSQAVFQFTQIGLGGQIRFPLYAFDGIGQGSRLFIAEIRLFQGIDELLRIEGDCVHAETFMIGYRAYNPDKLRQYSCQPQ